MSTLKFSASVMCANLARLEDDLIALEAAGCDELHFDIMDGDFVPNFALGVDFVKATARCSGLPKNGHLMVRDPERYIARFADAGCDSLTVHVEACRHPQRVLTLIREAGASPGIAINPASPLTKLDYLFDHADRVLVMAVDPGYAGQTLLPSAFERVRTLKENLDYRRLKSAIEVDGNIDVKNAATFARMGATIFVLGSSAIFNGAVGADLGPALEAFAAAVERERQVV